MSNFFKIDKNGKFIDRRGIIADHNKTGGDGSCWIHCAAFIQGILVGQTGYDCRYNLEVG